LKHARPAQSVGRIEWRQIVTAPAMPNGFHGGNLACRFGLANAFWDSLFDISEFRDPSGSAARIGSWHPVIQPRGGSAIRELGNGVCNRADTGEGVNILFARQRKSGKSGRSTPTYLLV
jgi:hypothetical protein